VADRKLAYVASGSLTITLASLATSSTLVAGAESDAIDNSTNKYLDYLISGKITTGTSPAAGRIEVWIVAELEDASWPDVFDGTGSAETWTTADIKAAGGQLAATIITDTTSNQTYYVGKFSVAALFGGSCPRKFVVFVTQNTTVNLHATAGNHALYSQGIYETIV